MQKTCSLETAKKLVEAGIVLETEKVWNYSKTSVRKGQKNGTVPYVFHSDKAELVTEAERENHNDDYSGNYRIERECYPAPDIAELLEALPNSIELKDLKIIKSNYLETNPISTMFWVGYWDKDGSIISYRNKELPEALAQLLIWVKTQEGVK